MEVWRCLESNNGDVRLRRSSVGWSARARVRYDGSGDTAITTTTTTADVTILMLLPLKSTRRMRSVGNLAPSANDDSEDDYLCFSFGFFFFFKRTLPNRATTIRRTPPILLLCRCIYLLGERASERPSVICCCVYN